MAVYWRDVVWSNEGSFRWSRLQLTCLGIQMTTPSPQVGVTSRRPDETDDPNDYHVAFEAQLSHKSKRDGVCNVCVVLLMIDFVQEQEQEQKQDQRPKGGAHFQLAARTKYSKGHLLPEPNTRYQH